MSYVFEIGPSTAARLGLIARESDFWRLIKCIPSSSPTITEVHCQGFPDISVQIEIYLTATVVEVVIRVKIPKRHSSSVEKAYGELVGNRMPSEPYKSWVVLFI